MTTAEDIKSALSRLSLEERRAVRAWLKNQLEDRLPMTDEFKGQIRNSEREKADGLRPRTR